ncbi:MAG TPA: hypothetical protein VJ966_05610 [Actinomycetes bacterium]|nr:hypothetical protein [Actinomycetes bacterium]
MLFGKQLRGELTVAQAIEELRRCAGSQFDPRIVIALSNLVIGLTWPPKRSTASAIALDHVPDRG